MTVLKQYDSGSSQWVPIVSGTTGATGPTGLTGATGVTGTVSLESPTFTGTPTLPTGTIATTQAAGNSTTAVATTAFVTTADNLKADLASPTFTGTPTLPTGTIATTQTAGNNTTAVATTAFVRTEVANLVASAPAALDTLDELASALGDDANFATTTATAIGLKAPLVSPSFTTPALGVATATSVNGTTIPTSKTLVVTTDKLSVLAATTSAELAGVISDETGTGSLVFSASPALTGTPTAPTASTGTNTTQIATTAFVTEAIPVASLQMFAGAVTQTVSSGVVTTTAPSGWLLCNGNAVSRTTYSTLFASVSTTYGVGDGTTTFNLPDMRSRMPIGTGTGTGLTARTLAGAGGVETVTLTSAQSGVPAHTHPNTVTNNAVTSGPKNIDHSHNFTPVSTPLNNGWSISAGGAGYMTSGTGITAGMNSNQSHDHSVTSNVTISNQPNATANAASAHDNMSPYLGVNFIIKAL